MDIKIKRTIAILLAVCFLVSLTASAVSAVIPETIVIFGVQPNLHEDTVSGQKPTKWAWNFGDGSQSTDKNPVDKYNKKYKSEINGPVKLVDY